MPSLTMEYAVENIVDGVLKNKIELAVPMFLGWTKFLK
jgi:hypothetical protein